MNKPLPLKIGLDFHGVINDNPVYFSRFTAEAVRRGYEVHIITGGPSHKVKELLDKWNICYTAVFAILDYYDAQGEVEYFENGEFKVSEKLWDIAKAEYCQLMGINMHIDDSTKYIKWFTTPYCHYDEKRKNCETENMLNIDFKQPPEKALNQIEKIVTSLQYY